MQIFATLTITDDQGTELGSKKFLVNFAEKEPAGWFANLLTYGAKVLRPVADVMQLEAEQARLDARRAALAEARET